MSSDAVQMTTSSADGQRKQVWRKCDNSRPETVLVRDNKMLIHFYLKEVINNCNLYGLRVLFTFLQVVRISRVSDQNGISLLYHA